VAPSGFRELVAYRLAAELANELYAEVTGWPWFPRTSLGLQLVRSADSIGANIAEGAGRWHTRDRRRFLFIARGSLYETQHWVLTAETRGLLEKGRLERLEEAARVLNGLIKRTPT
jgi:four helix bundle protein